ncbi:MAG: helix-turn-helix domain-containing protein [Myxococcaceae bacterium]
MLRMLISAPSRTFPIALERGVGLTLGRGKHAEVRVDDKTVAAEHLSLRVDADGNVTVDAAAPALLNGVQLTGKSAVRAGDEIVLGDTVLLFQHLSERPTPTPALWPWEPFVAELSSAVGPLGLLLVSSPTLVEKERAAWLSVLAQQATSARWAEVGPETVAAWMPEEGKALLAVRDRVQAALMGSRKPFRVGTAHRSEAFDGATVLEWAFARLFGLERSSADDELILHDASMMRLRALAERIGAAEGSVLVLGEPGAGKTTCAEWIISQRPKTRTLIRIDRGQTAESSKDVVAVANDWLSRELQRSYEHVLHIPALRDRPADIVPLAELFVTRVTRALGRSQLGLSLSVREALQSAKFEGNIRELKIAMERAALNTTGDEIRLESLPETVRRTGRSAAGTGGDLRASLKSAEKEALLQALGRTRWNVTETARQLGLPRRTVVYRMSKLGLRRPR